MPEKINGNRWRKLTKDEARYRLATMPGRHCHNCEKYLEGGYCRIVQGGVVRYHTCDHFEWDPHKY